MANTTVNRHRSAAMLVNELRELRSTSPITRKLETYRNILNTRNARRTFSPRNAETSESFESFESSERAFIPLGSYPPVTATATVSTTARETMRKSNLLNASPKKCHAPRPSTFTETSRKKNAVKQALATTKPKASVSSMPWCSTAIVAVFRQMRNRKKVLNLGCSAISRHSSLNSTHRRRRSSERRSTAVISDRSCPRVASRGSLSRLASIDRASFASARSASSLRACTQREMRRLTRNTSVAMVLVFFIETRAVERFFFSRLSLSSRLSPASSSSSPDAIRAASRDSRLDASSSSSLDAPLSSLVSRSSSSLAIVSLSRRREASPVPASLARNSDCARPNLDFKTARNRFTTKYDPKKTSATKYGTASSAPLSMTRYMTCAQPASVVH